MTKVSFVDNLARKGSVPIHFITCKDPEGKDCYYFLLSSDAKAKEMVGVSDGVFDINDYGKIIASGWGSEPSDEVKAQLKEEYGVEV
jgi:DUF1009 family protein